MSTQVYERIIGIAVKIARETDVHRLCSVLLQEAQSITGAQGGTLYLAAENENAEAVALEFVIVRTRHIYLMFSSITSRQSPIIKTCLLRIPQSRIDQYRGCLLCSGF